MNNFNLKQRRKELKMTLKDVADIVGVGESTVRKWELNLISNMKRDKIELLAKALKVSPLEIMGIQQNSQPDLVSNFRIDTRELNNMNLTQKDIDAINQDMQKYFDFIVNKMKDKKGDR